MKTYDFNLNIVDTDSISFSRKDGKPFSEKEQARLLKELNGQMREGIFWDHDGTFKTVIAVAAKNYVLDDGKKIKIKGSGLKATKKEPALKQFIKDFIDLLLKDETDKIPNLYIETAKKIIAIDEMTDISDWCFKVTATKKVLAPTTAFNRKVFDSLVAARVEIVEGDKYYAYFKPAKIGIITDPKTGKDKKIKIQDLGIREHYEGDICKLTLLKKLYVTAKVFQRVYDIGKLPNLTLKRNFKMLEVLRNKG